MNARASSAVSQLEDEVFEEQREGQRYLVEEEDDVYGVEGEFHEEEGEYQGEEGEYPEEEEVEGATSAAPSGVYRWKFPHYQMYLSPGHNCSNSSC